MRLVESPLIRVLILGESGVGKSTFINSLANYYRFDSLEQARASADAPVHLIAASFNLRDENLKPIRVQLGQESNEANDHLEGQACTQTAKSHFLTANEGQVKLEIIDTPGIGDPAGLVRDKENMQQTLAYLAGYDYINCICVLFKPNNERLTDHFRYCFKELLVHLHRNYTSNIVFCFTQSRNTSFRPGSTYNLLEKLLEDIKQNDGIEIPLGKDNVFCFDNEAFRFLMANRQSIGFSDDEMRDFSQSWQRSSQSAKRLVDYLSVLTRLNLNELLELKEARNLVTMFAKVIAKISQNIQANIQLAAAKLQELDKLDDFRRTNLEDKLHVKKILLRKKDLAQPRTVCTHASCTRVVTLENGRLGVDYRTVCHDKCHLPDGLANVINNPALKVCACMNVHSVCRDCHHDWSVHMHVTFEFEEFESQQRDATVQSLIDQNEASSVIVQQAKSDAETRARQLGEEQRELIGVSVQVAQYTRENAILPYNDDLGAYLDLAIRDEDLKRQNDTDNGGNHEQVLLGLKEVKQNYENEKQIFEKTRATANQQSMQGGSVTTLRSIKDSIRKLYDLPLNGPYIRSVVALEKEDDIQKVKI